MRFCCFLFQHVGLSHVARLVEVPVEFSVDFRFSIIVDCRLSIVDFFFITIVIWRVKLVFGIFSYATINLVI